MANDTLARALANKANSQIKDLGLNIKSLGGNGDGIHNDTQILQNIISSLPLHKGTSDLNAYKFSQGGDIILPPGLYKVTSTINLQRGVHIRGAGREATQIISFCAGSVFKYVDAGSGTQDEVVIENMSIIQDTSVTPSSGAAIECAMQDPAVATQSIGIILKNLYIRGTYHGVSIAAALWSSIDNVCCSHCVKKGFNVNRNVVNQNGATVGTTFQNCYAMLCGENGFYADGSAYLNFIGCASDGNTGYGFYFENCNSCTLLSCGAEGGTVGGLYAYNCTALNIGLYAQWNYPETNGTRHGIHLYWCQDVLINGTYMDATVATGYGIFIEGTARGKVILISSKFLNNFSGANLTNNTNYVLDLDGGKGLVGTNGKWAIGAPIPDSKALFNVGGYLDDGVEQSLKVNGKFKTPGQYYNSGAYVQASTDENNPNTFTQLNGIMIDNAANPGGGSTIQRVAGIHMKDQTLGTTAKANIMIDAGYGAVPSGNWNIYSESARNSLFKGDIEFGVISKGVIVRTPDNTKKYRIGVDNNGTLTATLVP